MSNKFANFQANFPKIYSLGINPNITALITAIAESDDRAAAAIAATKRQIFVKTASDQWLDRLSSGFGVQRPPLVGLIDDSFRNLIVNLSLKPKLVRRAFVDLFDVFWGPLYSRTNITSTNSEPFVISTGDALLFSVDGSAQLQAKALAGDIAIGGSATAEEIVTVLNRVSGITASVNTDLSTGFDYINIRTNTPGSTGTLEILGGTMVGALGLTLRKYHITDLAQRTVIYEVNNNEIVIELPATVPIVESSLIGSHHFHASAAIETPQWFGSFLYDPQGVGYTVTSAKGQLQSSITAGQVYTSITVDSTASIPSGPGYLIFDFGLGTEEQPVKYLSVLNANTIAIDPSHVFAKSHPSTSYVNALQPILEAETPSLDGTDLAVYVVDPVSLRKYVQTLFQSISAAGVVIRFSILTPSYTYWTTNPYA